MLFYWLCLQSVVLLTVEYQYSLILDITNVSSTLYAPRCSIQHNRLPNMEYTFDHCMTVSDFIASEFMTFYL